MYFPPAFFDIMIHLIMHLVREIKCCGPVYLQWMYPVGRYMKILKEYTKNLYHPEASIVEQYIAEEAIEFFSEYIEKAKLLAFLSLEMMTKWVVRVQEHCMWSLQV